MNRIFVPKLYGSQPIGLSFQHPCNGISDLLALDRMLAFTSRVRSRTCIQRKGMANRPPTMAGSRDGFYVLRSWLLSSCGGLDHDARKD